ncbi:MAG: hypothetical protein LBP79_04735 [Clostridiales bacterium]|nr:hypothetical protein [Clostridiales bacterium]
MEIWIKKLFAQIAFYMMKIIDSMFGMFRSLTGLSPVNVEGSGSADLLTYFLEDKNIQNAGLFIMLISLVCLAVFTVAAIIKTATQAKKTKAKSPFNFSAR